jgi:hypothetical protein
MPQHYVLTTYDPGWRMRADLSGAQSPAVWVTTWEKRKVKKIVNGKSYNTSTATEVCDIGNGLRKGDFKWDDSALYVTKKGAYFLAGEGGPASRWAREYSNMRIGGRGIKPLSIGEALSLAEEHAPADVIEEFFGDMIEEA